MQQNHILDIHSTFTPLMLGSIALIAFLSIRNTYLAGRTRDLCKSLLRSKEHFWQESYSLQLLYFVRRYKINNYALVSSILSVLFFGSMIGLAFLSSTQWLIGIRAELLVIGLMSGGVLATIATGISVYEIYIGRHSLFTQIACTIHKTNFSDPNNTLCDNIEEIEGVIRKSLLKQDKEDIKNKLNCTIKCLRRRANNEQTEASSMHREEHPDQSK